MGTHQAFHDIAAVAMKFVPRLRNVATVDKMSARSKGPSAGSPILLNRASAEEDRSAQDGAKLVHSPPLNEKRRNIIPARTILFGYSTIILHTTIASAQINCRK
jgi:hypothetical protein